MPRNGVLYQKTSNQVNLVLLTNDDTVFTNDCTFCDQIDNVDAFHQRLVAYFAPQRNPVRFPLLLRQHLHNTSA